MHQIVDCWQYDLRRERQRRHHGPIVPSSGPYGTPRAKEAHHRLRKKLEQLMSKADAYPLLRNRNLYLGNEITIGGTAHQAGTARFGNDPATSVLDRDCKAHELDNLYIAVASFIPSISAINLP